MAEEPPRGGYAIKYVCQYKIDFCQSITAQLFSSIPVQEPQNSNLSLCYSIIALSSGQGVRKENKINKKFKGCVVFYKEAREKFKQRVKYSSR